MSFFDDEPEPRQRETPPKTPRPWLKAPSGEIGGYVGWYIPLIRSDDTHVALAEVFAYPTGIAFTLFSRLRPGTFGQGPGALHEYHWGPKVGLEMSDGQKVFESQLGAGWDDQPSGPTLFRGGGHGGGNGRFSKELWLWPLPPAGPLVVVTAWPERNIAETSVTLNGDDLIAASQRAERLGEAGDAT